MTFEKLDPNDFRSVVAREGDGDHVDMSVGELADIITFKVTAEESAGTLTFLEYDARPHSPGVKPHWHGGHEELFYVLEGTLRMRLGDQVIDAEPGACVFVPRNVVHAFWNATDEPVKFVGTWTPAGFERLFKEREQIVADRGPLSDDENSELAAKHGVNFVALLPGQEH